MTYCKLSEAISTRVLASAIRCHVTVTPLLRVNEQFAGTPTFRRSPRNAGNSGQTFLSGTSGHARLGKAWVPRLACWTYFYAVTFRRQNMALFCTLCTTFYMQLYALQTFEHMSVHCMGHQSLGVCEVPHISHISLLELLLVLKTLPRTQ